jgi:enamine deaminase RidA (YjgF/YER057c/UK114 family)
MTFSRELSSSRATELYFLGSPSSHDRLAGQVREVYGALRRELSARGARIFAERIFATPEAMPEVEQERAAVMGDLDDGIPPTRVAVEPGAAGGFAGIQALAIAAPAPIEAMHWPAGQPDIQTPPNGVPVIHSRSSCHGTHGDIVHARQITLGADRWVFVSGLTHSSAAPPGEQATRVFHAVGAFLRHIGGTMHSVVRTWLWLRDICGWYADLNTARTAFFRSEGLIPPDGSRPRLPASTGIGLGSAAGEAIMLDLIAMPGGEGHIRFLEAGGEQQSAFTYGSAFSRAAAAPTPGGTALFISGTASIDPAGRTEHIGNMEAQIDATIAHVRALLHQAGCDDSHILSALVYCKTLQVEEAYRTREPFPPWPHLTLIGDICRPDLLFEIELTAAIAPGDPSSDNRQVIPGRRKRKGQVRKEPQAEGKINVDKEL